MPDFTYIEDIFVAFRDNCETTNLGLQPQDYPPLESFYFRIIKGDSLTQNQANYVLKILEKYKKISSLGGFDYQDSLEGAIWKRPFRVLDLSKKIFVEKSSDGKLEVCLKFPYQLKDEFDKEINVNISGSHKVSHWDSENKVRRLSFYNFNLVALYEFALKHNFEIDETFMCALAEVEEIWQFEDQIRPTAMINSSSVYLDNFAESAREYAEANFTGSIAADLMLAKSMGFLYTGPVETISQKIASSPENTFWLKDFREFFRLCNSVNGKIAIVIDRSSNILSWLQTFVQAADEVGIYRGEIKVCFRENKDSDTGINEWIKLAGVGGKIEGGRIYIFEHKPAKWLFKDKEDITIIATNNLYPHTNQVTKDWLDSHPCVIYLGDIKPSEQKGRKIVEL